MCDRQARGREVRTLSGSQPIHIAHDQNAVHLNASFRRQERFPQVFGLPVLKDCEPLA